MVTSRPMQNEWHLQAKPRTNSFSRRQSCNPCCGHAAEQQQQQPMIANIIL